MDDAALERQAGKPRIVEATLDELIDVYGPGQVQRMFDLRQLTDTQGRAWQSRLAKGPAFTTPVPADA